MHRGWHRLDNSDTSRPLENTRKAYIDSSTLGAGYAECDVWSTKDGEMMLSHDKNLVAMAQNEDDPLATALISDLTWKQIEAFPLKDGSTPVRLDTVLEDLSGTGTRLVIELKSSSPAKPLATFLAARRDLVPAVGFVMSFSLASVEQFVASNPPKEVRVLWLVDNPSIPYDEEVKNEGEQTFDYTAETLTAFLSRLKLTKRMQQLQCGLYMQYNPGLTPSHLENIRMELQNLYGTGAPKPFIGIWSDVGLDPDMDSAAGFSKWLPVVDALNTDMPDSFWSSAQGSSRKSSTSEFPLRKRALYSPWMLVGACLILAGGYLLKTKVTSLRFKSSKGL